MFKKFFLLFLIFSLFFVFPHHSGLTNREIYLAPRHINIPLTKGTIEPIHQLHQVGVKPSKRIGSGSSRRRFLNLTWRIGTAIIVAHPIVIWFSGCSDSKHRRGAPLPPANPAPEISIETHADWITGQLINTGGVRPEVDGLLKSYEDPNDPFAHTFNQAQAVMALLVAEAKFPGKGYRTSAQNILTALQGLQNPDGSFSAGFNIQNPAGDLLGKQTGGIAFVGLAINLYTLKTGDTQFVPMGERIADYLVSLAITRPSFPGQALENEVQNALSGEENLAVFSFLTDFALISTDPIKISAYQSLAGNIRQFLESLWDDLEGRFNQGRNSGGAINGAYNVLDPGYAADVQFSFLALGNSSGSFDFTRALDPSAPNSVKSILQTSSPSGIGFTLAEIGSGQDAGQTNRYALALSIAKRRNAALPITFDQEAAQQLVNAEDLAITPSTVDPATGIGTNLATGVSGTEGGVLITFAPRGFLTPQLGPSVEAGSEAIFAKAEVNFYLASEAITQFLSMDTVLQEKIINGLQQNERAQGDQLKEIESKLAEPLGLIKGNEVTINPKHVQFVWQQIKDAFPEVEKRRELFPSRSDFILGIIHHEAVVHPALTEIFQHYRQKGFLETKIKSFLDAITKDKNLFPFLEAFKERMEVHHNGREDEDLVEELLAQLISYATYPEGSQLKLLLTESKNPKILEHFFGFSFYYFGDILELLDKEVSADNFLERRRNVKAQLKEVEMNLEFDNQDELFELAFQETEDLEAAL